MNSQNKNVFTPPFNIKDTPTNNNKGKEIVKEKENIENIKELKTKVKKENDDNSIALKIDKETVKEKETEKENVNNSNKNINSTISSNNTNKNLNNYINTNTTKISNILSSWETSDKNKSITQADNKLKHYFPNTLRAEIHDLNKSISRTITENNLEHSNKIGEHRIKPSRPIFTSNKNTHEWRKDLFSRSEKIRTRPSEIDENEKPVEFESRINRILKFKNTLRRQSKQYKRKLKLTIPKSPNITKAVPRSSRDNWIVKPVMEKRKPKISLEKLFSKPFEIQVPHRMLPLPKFSLSSDKMRQQRLSLIKQNLIKEQESDQQKTQFHASEASNIILSNRTNVNVIDRLYHIKRNVPAIEKKEKVFKFKARPVPKSKPFIIKRIDKPLTEAISPILHSKIRAKERQIFDEKVHQHQLEMEKLQKEMELEKEKREKILIKQLRKKTVHHAKPAPNPNIVFRIKPSHQQLTIPKSPSFGHQRPYKSIQMNSIHRQMDRHLRSLSNESKDIKNRLRSLSNESNDLKGRLRSLSNESRELNNHFRNINDDSREFDKNDLSGMSYASSSSSISKELQPFSLSSLRISDTTSIPNKKSYLSTTSSKTTSIKPVVSTKSLLSTSSIRKAVPSRSSSSSTLVSPSSTGEIATSPLISPVLHSKPSYPSSSESSSITLKHSHSNSTIKSTSSSKSTEPPVVAANLKPVKPEPEDNTSHEDDNTAHSESLLNSLAYDISKSSIVDSTTTSTNHILSKSLLNEQSSTSKVLKNIQQQQKQLKQQQDQLQQQKKLKQKQQQEKQLREINKLEKEKLKKIMSKEYHYQGQEKFLQQVKQKQKVQEQLLQQQKQKQKQKQLQEQLYQKKNQQQEEEQLKQKQKQQQEEEQLKQKQKQQQEQLKQKQQIQKPLKKVKKENESPPKDTQKPNNTKTLKNTQTVKKEQAASNRTNSQNDNQSEDNLLSSPPSLLDMFSPTKKRPFPVFTDYNRKRNLFGDENSLQQSESYRTFKLFETINKHHSQPTLNKATDQVSTSNLSSLVISSPPFKTSLENNKKINSNFEETSPLKNNKEDQKKTLIEEMNNLNRPKHTELKQKDESISEKNSINQPLNESTAQKRKLDDDTSSITTKEAEKESPPSTPISNEKNQEKNKDKSTPDITDSSNPKSNSNTDSSSNNRQKRAKTRSKSFIDTNRNNNYSIHQKNRLSDVSMNIKQNILNDIMSFSPINASPSPFILTDSDRKKLKKKHLFDTPHPKKFEVAKRETQLEHEQRRKSEFLNKILYGDKVKKEDEEKERKEKERGKRIAAKAENYKVQWITIDEIKKNKKAEDASSSNLPFEITPIKTSLSDLDTPRNQIPFDSNIYKTPENNIIHRKEDDCESNPFKESSTKITTFISNVTRRTSRRLRQSLIN